MTEPRLIYHRSELTPQQMATKFYDAFMLKKGYPPGVPFGRMLGLLRAKFKYVDEETGELFIEFPSEEVFDREIRGFFADEYAASAGFAFNLFYKSYGNYAGKVPEEKEVRKPRIVEWETCDKCVRDFVRGEAHTCKEAF